MDTGDQAQVKEQKISKKMVRDQEVADMKELMSHAWGRRVLWRILSWAGVFKLSFSEGEHSLTDFKEGMRNIGLMLLDECNMASPDMFLLMQQEANAREFNRGISDGRK